MDRPLPHDGEHDGPIAQLDPDPELSLSGIVWTAVGIVAVTAVSMVLMLWLNGGLISKIETAQDPLTPAEELAVREARQAGEVRLETGEKPDLPELRLPADYALPPEPRLETTLTGEIDRLRAREREILDRWGWADESAGTVHVPIGVAIELAVAGALPAAGSAGAGTGEGDADVDDPAASPPAAGRSDGGGVRDGA